MLMLPAVVTASSLLMISAIPMNAINFGGGQRLTVAGNPKSLQPQDLLLDTGSSTLAFCDSTLASGLEDLKTDYLSCNLYGSGNEGYWGPFYHGVVTLGSEIQLEDSYYSIMQQEVSMPCGAGLQGIFGVAFKQLDQAAEHPSPLEWPTGSVGSCPAPSTTLVGPLMHYLKQDTKEGRLGIYWSGKIGASEGELFVGPTAVSNPHYTQGTAVQAQLGETGYYDITIEQMSFAGQSSSVSCGSESPCLVDTGTPIMIVPQEIYQQITGGQTGSLSIQLTGVNGDPVTLEFDAATLAQQNLIAPYQGGGPYILGLPLWATYYTVFNVANRVIEFVQHSSTELAAFQSKPKVESTDIVV